MKNMIVYYNLFNQQQMSFYCPRTMWQLSTAFSEIMDANLSKIGEQRLERVRGSKFYQQSLIMIMVNSDMDYHHKLLATVLLEKKKIIEEVTMIWSLRVLYFKEDQKIAVKICNLMTMVQNIPYAGQFFKGNFESMGIRQYFRLTEFIFSILRNQEIARMAIQYHFDSILKCIIEAITSMKEIQSEDCLFQIVVCTAQLYNYISSKETQKQQKVHYHWKIIQEQNIKISSLVYQTIKNILCQEQIKPQINEIYILFTTIFNSIEANNQISLKYLRQLLSILITKLNILQDKQTLLEFIRSIRHMNSQKNIKILINLKISNEVELNNDLQLQNEDEAKIYFICGKLIQSIFQYHWQSLFSKNQLQMQNNYDLLGDLLPLLNYCNSLENQKFGNFISHIILKVISKIEFELSTNNFQSLNSVLLDSCITQMQFLIKYKGSIQLRLLPHVVHLLSKVTSFSFVLSPLFCSFLDSIWKDLTFLQLKELAQFLEDHLVNIALNQWGNSLNSYSCFLNIAVYMEETYEYFSKESEFDSLMIQIIQTYNIFNSFLAQSRQMQLNFQVIYALIGLTRSIIDNSKISHKEDIYNVLNPQILVKIMYRYSLLNEDSAVIVAYHHYHCKTLMESLKTQSRGWLMDHHDYQFKIQLFLQYLFYAKKMLNASIVNRFNSSLAQKVRSFLGELDQAELIKFQQRKLWIEVSCLLDNYKSPVQKMEIEYF